MTVERVREDQAVQISGGGLVVVVSERSDGLSIDVVAPAGFVVEPDVHTDHDGHLVVELRAIARNTAAVAR